MKADLGVHTCTRVPRSPKPAVQTTGLRKACSLSPGGMGGQWLAEAVLPRTEGLQSRVSEKGMKQKPAQLTLTPGVGSSSLLGTTEATQDSDNRWLSGNWRPQHPTTPVSPSLVLEDSRAKIHPGQPGTSTPGSRAWPSQGSLRVRGPWH